MTVDPIFLVINRKKDDKRKEHMLSVEKIINTNFTFFSAVDGRTELNIIDSTLHNIKFILYNSHLFIHDITKQNVYHKHVNKDYLPSYGIFGAAISHYLIYHRLLNDNNNESYGIFEDDIRYIFEDGGMKLKNTLDFLPATDTFDVALLFHPRWPNNVKVKEECNYYFIVNNMKFAGAYAYIITKRGAGKFLSFFRNYVCSSPDDNLSTISEQGNFDIIVLKEPLFTFEDVNFPSATHDQVGEVPENTKWDRSFESMYYKDINDLKTNFKEQFFLL